MKKNPFLLFILLFSFASHAQVIDKIKKTAQDNKTVVTQNKTSDTYQVGEVVEVYDPIEKAWFPSSILKVQDGKYFIHYTNYDPKWDTWVTAERIRNAGVGNKNDPGPATSTATTTSNSPTTTSTTTAPTTANTPPSNTDVKTEGSYPVSEKAGPTGFPIIYTKDKSLFFRIGDPVIYELDGKKDVYTIADINYNGDIKSMSSFNDQELDFNLNKVELVNGFNYQHFPSTISNGVGDKFKEGDMVEVLCYFNDYSVKYKWEKGLVVSVDGDNYYIYRPGTSYGGEKEYFWHYISEMRAIGSNKTVKMPPEYGDQNNNPNASIYYKTLKSSECDGHNDWEFIWYYRHDFGSFNPRLVMASDKFKAMIDQYNCIYDARKDYPDIGIGGYDIQTRYDVQWEFLQKRNEYIKMGIEKAAQARFYEFTLKVKNADYADDMANKNGYGEIKKKATGDRTKDYDECAKLMGFTIQYPWVQLDSAYQQGVRKFMSEETVEYKGLEYSGAKFDSKDAKAEAVTRKEVLSIYPGSTVISSGTSGDFSINKDSYGVPTSREKTVIVIHKNPGYRTCIITECLYREDYAGGGTYGAGYIYGQLTGSIYLKSCP